MSFCTSGRSLDGSLPPPGNVWILRGSVVAERNENLLEVNHKRILKAFFLSKYVYRDYGGFPRLLPARFQQRSHKRPSFGISIFFFFVLDHPATKSNCLEVTFLEKEILISVLYLRGKTFNSAGTQSASFFTPVAAPSRFVIGPFHCVWIESVSG